MDSFARHVLLTLSGKSRVQRIAEDEGRPEKIQAIDWLTQVFFTPSLTRNDPVFLINHPEVVQALGVEKKKRRRYSFAELAPHLAELERLKQKAERVEDEDRSLVEKGFIDAWNDVNVYLMLVNFFEFARPSQAFAIQDKSMREKLGLPEDQLMFSYYDMVNYAVQLGTLMDELKKPQEEWTDQDRALFSVANAMFQTSQRFGAAPFGIVPMTFHGKEDWIAPWEVLQLNLPDQELNKALKGLAGLVSSYVTGDMEKFNQLGHAWNLFVEERAGENREVQNASFEVQYNEARLFFWCKFLYFYAFFLAVFAVLFGGRVLPGVALILLLLALFLHLTGMGWRVYLTARPPVTNLYGTFVFVSLICVLLGLVVERVARNSLGVLASGLVGFTLLMIAARFGAEGDTMGKVVAVLNSNFWLSTHVIAINTGYAGVWLAGVFGHVYLIQAMISPRARVRLQATFGPMMGILAFGLTFSFLGTMLGGIWADQSWGRFWGWDPKENGALLIVLWTAVIYHARMAGLIGDVGTAAAVALGNIVVMFAWLGVNVMGVGLHSYGFTSGIAHGLRIYYLLEVIFVISSMYAIYLKSRKSSKPIWKSALHKDPVNS